MAEAATSDTPTVVEVKLMKYSDPVTWWVRNNTEEFPSPALQELTAMLTTHCNSVDTYHAKASPNVCKEKLIAVKNYKEGVWARALFKEFVMTTQGEQVHVFLVDSAKTLNVPFEWIRSLPEAFKQLPKQVNCFVLPGLHPLGLETAVVTSDTSNPLQVRYCIVDDWDSSSKHYVNNILKEHTAAYVEYTVTYSEPLHGKLYVEFRGQRCCLNESLVLKKLAAPCVGAPDCPHRSCRSVKPNEPLEVKITSSSEQDICSPTTSSLSSFSSAEDRERLVNDWHAMQLKLDQQLGELQSTGIKKSPMGRGQALFKKYMMSTETDTTMKSPSTSPFKESTEESFVMNPLGVMMSSERTHDVIVNSGHVLSNSGSQVSGGLLNAAVSHLNLEGSCASAFLTAPCAPLCNNKSSARFAYPPPVSTSIQPFESKITPQIDSCSVSRASLLDNPIALRLKLQEIHRCVKEIAPTKAKSVTVASLTNARIESTESTDLQSQDPNLSPFMNATQPTLPLIAADSFIKSCEVSKEGYRNVFVHGEMPVKPVTSLLHTPFSICIKERLLKQNYTGPIFLQYHVWPEVLRGRHVVLIGRRSSGKTLGYLLPLLTLVLKPEMYKKTPKGNGPLVLVLCSTLQSAEAVFRHCRIFAEDSVKVVLVTSSSSEKQLKEDLVQGCDIVIATPDRFLQMLKVDKGRVTNLTRLCHLVVDDAHLLTENYTQALKDIIQEYCNHRTQLTKSQIRNCPSQMVICGERWTPGACSFVQTFMVDPVVYMSSLVEATIFCRLKVVPHMCSTSTRDPSLIDILANFTAHRIVICTSDTQTAINVHELLRLQCLYSLLIHGDLSASEVGLVHKEWHMAHSATTHPILVVSDNRLVDLSINNATCLIHYDLPTMSKGLFDDRFAFLLRGLQEFQNTVLSASSLLSSQIIITEQCTNQASSLVDYLSRIPNVKVPKELCALAAGRKAGKEESAEELCNSWKAFGRCRQISHCMYRHTPNPIKDDLKVPNAGQVDLLITFVIDASHYYGRLLKHNTTGGKEVDLKLTYWKLSGSLNAHYSKGENRCVAGMVTVGSVCGYLDKDGAYHRIRVKSTPDEDRNVEVFFLDLGRTDKVPLMKLLKLPLELQSVTQQAVEVYLCGVTPVDNNPGWSIRANTFVHSLIHGKVLVGKVKHAIGMTLWLDPLCKPTVLGELKVKLWEFIVTEKLLSKNFASNNPTHLELITASPDRFLQDDPTPPEVTTPPEKDLKPASTGSVSNEVPPEGLLSVTCLQSVYVPFTKNPDLFYVQKAELAERFDELCAKINESVSKLPTVQEVVNSEIYLAPSPTDSNYERVRVEEIRDDGSISVFSVDTGDCSSVSKKQLRFLPPEYRKLPFQAVCCALAGIAPAAGTVWPKEVKDAFCEMVLDEEDCSKLLKLKVSRQLPLPANERKSVQYEVFLYDHNVSDISMNALLVHNKFAVKTLPGPFPEYDVLVDMDNESLDTAQFNYAAAQQVATSSNEVFSASTIASKSTSSANKYSVDEYGGKGDGQHSMLEQSLGTNIPQATKTPIVEERPCSVAAPVRWHQTNENVTLNIVLSGVKSYSLDVSTCHVQFSAFANGKQYNNDIELYASVNEENKRVSIIGQNTTIVLPKIAPGKWPRLLNGTTKVPWLSVNFDHIELSSDSSSDREVRLPPPRRHVGKGQVRCRAAKPADYYYRRGRSSSSSDDDDRREDDSGQDDHFRL